MMRHTHTHSRAFGAAAAEEEDATRKRIYLFIFGRAETIFDSFLFGVVSSAFRHSKERRGERKREKIFSTISHSAWHANNTIIIIVPHRRHHHHHHQSVENASENRGQKDGAKQTSRRQCSKWKNVQIQNERERATTEGARRRREVCEMARNRTSTMKKFAINFHLFCAECFTSAVMCRRCAFFSPLSTSLAACAGAVSLCAQLLSENVSDAEGTLDGERTNCRMP